MSNKTRSIYATFDERRSGSALMMSAKCLVYLYAGRRRGS